MAVELGAARGRYGAVEERVAGIVHPLLEPPAHLLEHVGVRRLSREVARLVGVEVYSIELLLGNGAFGPTVRQQQVLARPVVGVGQNGSGMVVIEAAAVRPCP